jgi:AraC-like DNA-binding protein/quercetin dioxygenase-like cupin family protein
MNHHGMDPADDAPALRIRTVFYREVDVDWQVGTHHHDVHQWYLCLHGGVRLRVGGDLHLVEPERSVIVPPGVKRELLALRRAPGYLVAIFDPVGIDLSAITGRLLTLPSSLRDDLHALIEELRRPGDDHLLLVRALLLRLLIGHKRAGSAPAALSALNARSHDEVIAAAEGYMRANLHRSLRRSEIAAAVHLSEPHLARLFRSATGMTVLGRLTELRIASAKALLLESTLSVGQITGEVGIISFSHFARTFKRLVGVSPGDYRRSGGRIWN